MTQRDTRPSPAAVERLSDLSQDERSARFQQLQLRMPAVWDSWKHDFEDESVVVIPSVSVSKTRVHTISPYVLRM